FLTVFSSTSRTRAMPRLDMPLLARWTYRASSGLASMSSRIEVVDGVLEATLVAAPRRHEADVEGLTNGPGVQTNQSDEEHRLVLLRRQAAYRSVDVTPAHKPGRASLCCDP